MSSAPHDSVALRLKRLPKVDKVLRLPAVEQLEHEGGLPHWAVLEAVRAEIARLREALLKSAESTNSERAPDDAEVDIARIAKMARALYTPTLRPVINATGVVLHTNLGRAPLPEAALRRIAEVGGGYMTLEYDLLRGERGSRQAHLQRIIERLTGAEASLVVNNNAAAVLLMLAGLCAGREVIVSRGELVEIGGSFRVPDVMQASSARLREVGTTNRTHRRDYEAAISTDTRALLKVHRSNFALVGFTAEVSISELVSIAKNAGLLCMYDLGGGALECAAVLQDPLEPKVEAALAAGCDLVSFSCDKLLGGPQAGILCGSRDAIEPLRQHPLLRALRPDKLTLLALQATLELYRDGRTAEIPTLAMLSAPLPLLHRRALKLQTLCAAEDLATDVFPTRSAVGGGAMPLIQPESYAVAPRCDAAHARRIEEALRKSPIAAVVARLSDERLVCDVRTVNDPELPILARALVAAHGEAVLR